MVSRIAQLERKSILVQFIAVDPLTFYATSDGTDLVQDILRSKLARADADIFGQEGSVSIDEQGEFLTFEPSDTQNRTLHLPIEYLAYSGALRRMRRDTSDQRDSDQIHRRDFENVDLANRYAQYIIGPPIFVAVFHGFDNALCYTFITQSADDACLLVMKLMRAFKLHEQQQQQLEEQGHEQQGYPSQTPIHRTRSPSPLIITQGTPVLQSSQVLCTDHRPYLSCNTYLQTSSATNTFFPQDPCQDEFIQKLLVQPDLQVVHQPNSACSSCVTCCSCCESVPLMSRPPSSVRQFCFSADERITSVRYGENLFCSRCAVHQAHRTV